jgi:hypothetical protein
MRIPRFSLLILTPFLAATLSCLRQDTFPEVDTGEILQSTGWKLDTYVFRFNNGQPDAELDTLVLNIIRTDSMEESRSVYTGRWIVFDNESVAVTAFNYDLYTRKKGDSVWTRKESDLTGEGFTEWGMDQTLQPYLNPNSDRPILIDLLDEQTFALTDAYLIKSAQPLPFGDDSIKYIFGTFDPGTLLRIDAIYRAAGRDDGPNWFPAWRFWPL